MNPIDEIKGFAEIDPGIHTTLINVQGASYDNKARAYEKLVSSKLYNKIMWGTRPSDYMKFSKKAILETKGIELDIGCGGLIQTAEQYAATKNEVVLLDNSIEMLKVGKSRIEMLCKQIPSNIHFVQSDAFQIPFANNSFDTICCFGVLHIFDEKQRLVNEAMRVLKPSGKFFFTSLTSDRKFSRHYISFLRKQGEFGRPIKSRQTVELFEMKGTDLDWYTLGSMVFITGLKKDSH